MLIVDVNALLTVNLQNFLNEVVMNGGRAADTQDIVRGQRAVLQLRALGDDVAVVHAKAGVRHRVDAVVAVVRGDDDVEQAALGRLFEADLTADLGEGRHLLGTARLKQFLSLIHISSSRCGSPSGSSPMRTASACRHWPISCVRHGSAMC